MRFNNLLCRHAQCIFKTFKRFFNLFYFQIIIGLLSPLQSPLTCIIAQDCVP